MWSYIKMVTGILAIAAAIFYGVVPEGKIVEWGDIIVNNLSSLL